jgi:hypothetical protein
VDVDIMDSTKVPGLRYPAGPGPALGDVENCLTAISASVNVVAACLAWALGSRLTLATSRRS